MKTIAEMETDFIKCRVRRHSYDDIPDDGGVRRMFEASSVVIRLCQRCVRCGTTRYEAWSRVTGAIMFVDYRYPPDYLLKSGRPGGRGVNAADLRLEYLDRLDGDGQKRAMRSDRSRRAAATKKEFGFAGVG